MNYTFTNSVFAATIPTDWEAHP